MYKILLVGLGQLGSRYLEGMAKSKLNLDIVAVDQSKTSIKKAKNIWNFKNKKNLQKNINWHQKLPLYNSEYDLAIICTSSRGRAKLISSISKKITIKFWILEKILAQSIDELDLIYLSTLKSHKIYVNTPRRIMKWYKKIKIKLSKSKILKISNTDSKFGLVCNAVHYIDLISWLTGKLLISVNTSKLKRQWFHSKRKEYYEVDGELLAKFEDNLELSMKSNPNLEKKMQLNLGNQTIWTINEYKGVAKTINGDKILGKLELQSEMTPLLLKQLLICGFCDLPELKESIIQHKKLIAPLLKHWNKVNNRNDKLLPIT